MNITYDQLNQNDVVFTPDDIAKTIVAMFPIAGSVLEPCSGEGAFLRYLPPQTQWCEITKGRDFFDYHERVDWIVTNPPYSNFDRFLAHAFDIAENVVFLVPIGKVFKSWGTIQKVRRYGGIKSVWFVPASRCGFPFGFPAGAFHFERQYTGPTQITYAPERVDNQHQLRLVA